MSEKAKVSRRKFLATSTKTAAALQVGSLYMAGTAAAARRKIGANDRVHAALIGSGGRGTSDMAIAVGADNVVCSALCDVAEFRMKAAENTIVDKLKKIDRPVNKIDHYDDYRRVLDRKDIDGVIIATPDHWHYTPFMAALEAGKHIYQEKPMSHTIEQGLKMVKEAKEHPELVVQVGTQSRSYLNYAKAKEVFDTGLLGDIRFIRCFDCRNWTANDPFEPYAFQGKVDWDQFQTPCAKKREYDPYRYFAWRWFWDYAGGLVTDVGVHVMDIVHWMTGQTMPKSVVCNGGVYQYKKWQTPDVVNATWDFGTHAIAFTSNFTNKRIGAGIVLYGSKATLEIVRGNVVILSEGKEKKPLHEFKHRVYQHQHNWIDCIRTGKTPNAPVELGFSSLLPSFLANIAYREGKKVGWDSATQKPVM
ncbi:MAG: Gfo/Idh/MocA family protein [Planctomycetota bacterium]|jgi:predicted dehydrogenase